MGRKCKCLARNLMKAMKIDFLKEGYYGHIIQPVQTTSEFKIFLLVVDWPRIAFQMNKG